MNRGANNSEILGVLGLAAPETPASPPPIEARPELTPPLSINPLSAQPEIVIIDGVEHQRIAKEAGQTLRRLPQPVAKAEAWNFTAGADERGDITIHGSGNAEAVIEAMRRFLVPQTTPDYAPATVEVEPTPRQLLRPTAQPTPTARIGVSPEARPTKERPPRVKRALIIGGLALATISSFNLSTGRLSPTDIAANAQATLTSPITMFNDAAWLIKKLH